MLTEHLLYQRSLIMFKKKTKLSMNYLKIVKYLEGTVNEIIQSDLKLIK